ncbi:trypsin-like serine protease [Roseibacterium sp. SDUM158017]|uniref:trypsin-like serine peptidase n=1 Tax=Roseicyclus salinarum TaxID=3036773 RepID=UPI0024156C8A|nr:trypsin-like serine protease [Roseibacterium sp. SDUM158017]MDG4650484.1 trypsin-like serine protease [Roseibacterium sp. SDUM158017]
MLTRLAAALALAAATSAQTLHAQDYTLPSTFGVFTVVSGFEPDPNWVSLLAGGSLRAEYTDQSSGGACAGYFAEAPDFRIVFTDGEGLPLSFYVEAREDTVLLVNAPDGAWHCNDDASGLNPAVSFETPLAGQYDIWVGTYAATEDYPPAMLAITEGEPFAGTYERAFFGQDDRVEVDPTAAPWSMIGFLDLSGTSCTGVLIGPRTVLTAAHCIANAGVIETPPVEFLAGYDRGSAVARSRATGYHVPGGWMAGEQEGTDFAFVYLADPIGDAVGWMDVTGLSQGEIADLMAGGGPAIMQAGYSYDRDGVLTGNLACPFVEIGPDSTLVHECDTLQGDSGSPLFIEDGGRYRIVGIESHTDAQPRESYDRNVAMYADYIMAEMRALAAGQASAPQQPSK